MAGTHFQDYVASEGGIRVGSKDSNIEVITPEREIKNIKSVDAEEVSVKEIKGRGFVSIFDDFLYQTMAETYTPWILNEGTDGDAADPAINAQTGGAARFVGGAGNGSIAEDASQMVCHIPIKLEDVDKVIIEARVKLVTAITHGRLFVGLTDTTNREIAFSIATAAVTSVATDAVGLLYDDGATAKTWHALSVSNNVDSNQNYNTTVAPAIVYQTIRIEAAEDAVDFFIDGNLVHTITHSVPRKANNLYATVCLSTTGTTRTMDLDYFYIGHNR